MRCSTGSCSNRALVLLHPFTFQLKQYHWWQVNYKPFWVFYDPFPIHFLFQLFSSLKDKRQPRCASTCLSLDNKPRRFLDKPSDLLIIISANIGYLSWPVSSWGIYHVWNLMGEIKLRMKCKSYILLSCAFISAKKSLEIEFILEDCTKVIKYVESAASSALELGVSLSVGLKQTKPNYSCLEHL